jgi:rifampicin phosphotransferase
MAMSSAQARSAQQLTPDWRAPEPGHWELDRSHFVGAPTPLLREFALPNLEAGLEAVFVRAGIPMRTFAHRIVGGHVYRRLSPLIGRGGRRPPDAALWLVFRLHPELRRRTRQARRAFEERIWREELENWHEERPRIIERNLALQAEDLTALDDAALGDHLRRAFGNAGTGYRLHFELRPVDAGPVGDLLLFCECHGVEAGEVLPALAGASPASSAPLGAVATLAEQTRGRELETLDDVRALGEEASTALDDYLREYGWRMVTSYDVDGRTLIELPGALLTSLQTIRSESAKSNSGRAGIVLRERLPAAERSRLDELVHEASTVYGLRDDNGPLTVEWPTGLLRRAVLEAGRRLAERSMLEEEAHACELGVDELEGLLAPGSGPAGADVAARAARRLELATLSAPRALGDPEPKPPDWVLPGPIRRTVRILRATVSHLEAVDEQPPLVGTGIGSEQYRGRARVASSPEDVAAMEHGDVLVAPFTNPAYNTLLFIAGAVVCEQGGSLSHAAIIARELGIPAVVGAEGATEMIRDGEEVEVDPVAGQVRRIDTLVSYD